MNHEPLVSFPRSLLRPDRYIRSIPGLLRSESIAEPDGGRGRGGGGRKSPENPSGFPIGEAKAGHMSTARAPRRINWDNCAGNIARDAAEARKWNLVAGKTIFSFRRRRHRPEIPAPWSPPCCLLPAFFRCCSIATTAFQPPSEAFSYLLA